MLPVKVDPRAGSGDLLPMFQMAGIPSAHEQLDYGDVSLVGRGPDERPVFIGIEIKTVNDLIQCLVSKRFVGQREDGTPGQLGGLLQTYELVYVVVEGTMINVNGELRIAKAGRVDKPAGDRPWRYDQVQGFLHSIRRAGVDVVPTVSRRDTADWIGSLWRWWNVKSYEEHDSVIAMKQKPLLFDLRDTYTVTRKMKIAAQLAEGVGMRRARAAAEHFAYTDPIGMVSAPMDEWLKVDGFGRKLAERIHSEMRRRGA
jgi:ERCC4-type nuclease